MGRQRPVTVGLDAIKFQMYLSDAKVAVRFGSRPWMGKLLPMTDKKRVTVGIKWSLPKKDYIPDEDVLVTQCVALRCIKKGLWEVSCSEMIREQTVNYLIRFCT